MPLIYCALISAALSTGALADDAQPARPAGLRVFYTGHSFHMFVPGRVEQLVKAAGIEGHKLVGTQGIGGSRVIQHWDLAEERNKAKAALSGGELDVFTMAAHVDIPDEGIAKFTELGLKHNPNLRLLVQASWYPFDLPSAEHRIRQNAQRDDMKIEDLQTAVDGWRKELEAQIDELNTQHDRRAVFINPVGDAVVKLRALVVEGKYPGVKTQSELFTDPIGHAGPHVQALAAYCNFAAIYRMSPEGLKVDVNGVDDAQNTILQHLAWETVSNYKYAGVRDDEPSVEGARAIEGAPEDGLPYRVLIGTKATPEAPHRMVVWLHPSGGSMNNVVERLAPQLNEQELALVMFTQKDFRGWSQADAKKMMTTLDALGETKGVSADKPLLLGCSAGGQLALMLWNERPDNWGGLILDAAYPVTFDPQTRKAKLADLPDDAEAVKQTPFFVLVGGRDGGARLWQQAEETWRAAGIPLHVEYVPNQGHTWLFGDEQRQHLTDWLDAISNGKKPSETIGEPAPPRGVLGVTLDGTRIEQVLADSPAAKAGLQLGDVINTIDSVEVADRPSIVDLISTKKPGDKLKLTILRDGQTHNIEATLAASQ